jgi:hypothetical protein
MEVDEDLVERLLGHQDGPQDRNLGLLVLWRDRP